MLLGEAFGIFPVGNEVDQQKRGEIAIAISNYAEFGNLPYYAEYGIIPKVNTSRFDVA